MEKLTINIPETKSALVKQLLKELGVVFQSASKKEVYRMLGQSWPIFRYGWLAPRSNSIKFIR